MNNPLATFPNRTQKQPLRWRCRNPECIVEGKPFEFEADDGCCPRCTGRPPHTLLMTLIHLLVKVTGGPILGRHQQRLALACEPTRGYLTTGADNEAASGDPRAVNCPGCLAALQSGKIKAPVATPVVFGVDRFGPQHAPRETSEDAGSGFIDDVGVQENDDAAEDEEDTELAGDGTSNIEH